jgi:hypothetical protein
VIRDSSYLKQTESQAGWILTVPGIVVWVIVLLTSLGGTAALAQEPKSFQEENLVHYAFAAHLGTGIYATSGHAVTVIAIPLSYTVRPMEEHDWGLKLKFPVTFGFFDFQAMDIVNPGLPGDVETVTLVPGVEFQIPVYKNWWLMPFGDLGVGKDLSGGEHTYIYSGGVKSLVVVPWKSFDFSIGNKFLYAGHTIPSTGFSDDFRLFETGLDVSHPVDFTIQGRQAYCSLYFMNFLYSNLAFSRFRSDEFKVNVQYEVGLTLGTAPPSKLWRFKISRIGLGYRFGDNLSLVRLVFGMPF